MPRHKRDPRDVEIAKRVRTLRLQRGMSQTELGGVLDVTFQQVQKYETGSNRISAGRLQQIAEVLAVPVTYFYSGLQDAEAPTFAPVEGELDFLQSPHPVETSEAHRVHRRRVKPPPHGVSYPPIRPHSQANTRLVTSPSSNRVAAQMNAEEKFAIWNCQ